jgi:hypothetical protein
MKHTYRKFLAADIPVSIQGGLVVFDWAKFENKLHVNIGQSMYVNIIKIVQGVIDDLNTTEFFNENSLKANIAVRLTTNLYPLYCGIKEDSKVNQEYKLKYIDIDQLLNKPYDLMDGAINKETVATSQEKSNVIDATPYVESLVDTYVFSFNEAKEIVSRENISLDDIMSIIKKVTTRTEDRVKDQILKDIVSKFSK